MPSMCHIFSFFQVSLLRRLIVDVAALKCLEIRYALPASLIIRRHYGERYVFVCVYFLWFLLFCSWFWQCWCCYFPCYDSVNQSAVDGQLFTNELRCNSPFCNEMGWLTYLHYSWMIVNNSVYVVLAYLNIIIRNAIILMYMNNISRQICIYKISLKENIKNWFFFFFLKDREIVPLITRPWTFAHPSTWYSLDKVIPSSLTPRNFKKGLHKTRNLRGGHLSPCDIARNLSVLWVDRKSRSI